MSLLGALRCVERTWWRSRSIAMRNAFRQPGVLACSIAAAQRKNQGLRRSIQRREDWTPNREVEGLNVFSARSLVPSKPRCVPAAPASQKGKPSWLIPFHLHTKGLENKFSYVPIVSVPRSGAWWLSMGCRGCRNVEKISWRGGEKKNPSQWGFEWGGPCVGG